jgi:hypothetical protein
MLELHAVVDTELHFLIVDSLDLRYVQLVVLHQLGLLVFSHGLDARSEETLHALVLFFSLAKTGLPLWESALRLSCLLG